MRRAHIRSVFAEGDVFDLLIRLLPAGDLLEGLHYSEDILLKALFVDERIDLADCLAGVFADELRVLVGDGLPGVFVHLADELRQKNAPGDVDGDDILPVDYRNARCDLPFLHYGRDEMDADDARALRVQRRVVDFVEVLHSIIVFALCYLHFITSPESFGLVVIVKYIIWPRLFQAAAGMRFKGG